MEDNKKKSQVSQKKLEANRANARRSTGPTSPAGKAKAAQNSYKHGVFARRLFSNLEQSAQDRADYGMLYRSFFEQYSPVGPLETFLLEKITTTTLRQARLLEFEQKMLGWIAPFESRSTDRVMRYEAMLTRFFNNAVEQLEHAQQIRKAVANQLDASDEELESAASESQEMTGDQSEQLEDSAAGEPEQPETIPPVGPTDEELLEALDLGPYRTQNCGTNPPQNTLHAQFTDDEPPTDDSDYDDRDDWHPRLTAADLLDGADRIEKEH
jgi:hypothetical protein